MEDEFHFPDPFPALGFQVTVVKTDKEEFRRFLNFKAVAVLRKDQEKFIGRIRQLMLVNELNAFTLQDKHHFKKSFFMLPGSIMIRFPELQFKRAVKIFNLHTCKDTEQTPDCTNNCGTYAGTLNC